jgi:hypothetical protein
MRRIVLLIFALAFTFLLGSSMVMARRPLIQDTSDEHFRNIAAAIKQSSKINDIIRSEEYKISTSGELSYDGMLAREYPPWYGGRYFNDDGNLVLLLQRDYSDMADGLRLIAGNPDLIIKTVKYSHSQLLQSMDEMFPALGKTELGFELISTAVDTINNRVIVGVYGLDFFDTFKIREYLTYPGTAYFLPSGRIVNL